MSSADIVYPLLIAVGCIGLALVVHLLTRPKPTRNDIAVPGATSASPSTPQPAELASWHRDHENTLASFVETTDEAAGLVRGAIARQAEANPSTSGAHSLPNAELAAAEAPNNALQAAIDSHPSAEMQGELAALRAASLALVGANEREDDEAIDRYKPVYLEYRQAWVERMWQFCTDRQRVGNLRKRQ